MPGITGLGGSESGRSCLPTLSLLSSSGQASYLLGAPVPAPLSGPAVGPRPGSRATHDVALPIPHSCAAVPAARTGPVAAAGEGICHLGGSLAVSSSLVGPESDGAVRAPFLPVAGAAPAAR